MSPRSLMNAVPPQEREILQERARRLARESDDVEELRADNEFFLLRLHGERYAVPLNHLTSVAPVSHLAPLPGAPQDIAGLMYVEGQIITVVDIGFHLFGEPSSMEAAALVGKAGERMALGFDAYENIIALDLNAAAAPPKDIHDQVLRYLEAVTANGIAVLNLEKLTDDLLNGDNFLSQGDLDG